MHLRVLVSSACREAAGMEGGASTGQPSGLAQSHPVPDAALEQGSQRGGPAPACAAPPAAPPSASPRPPARAPPSTSSPSPSAQGTGTASVRALLLGVLAWGKREGLPQSPSCRGPELTATVPADLLSCIAGDRHPRIAPLGWVKTLLSLCSVASWQFRLQAALPDAGHRSIETIESYRRLLVARAAGVHVSQCQVKRRQLAGGGAPRPPWCA